MLSHTYFMNHTETFYQFYKEFMISTTAKPNKAHLYLAELEKRKNLTVITQNIDGLHQMAGSKNVIELHGSVHRNYCMNCYRKYDLSIVLDSKGIPTCPHCGGVIKPDVVLYEEALDDNAINGAVAAISRADLLIVAGTSLRVYPASGLIRFFKGRHLVVINKEPLYLGNAVELELTSPVGEVFGQLK